MLKNPVLAPADPVKRSVPEVFGKAIHVGDPSAQYALGIMLYDGSLPENLEEAFVLMKRAAERNYLAAQLTLATFYGTGVGTKANNAEAIHWYRQVLEHPQLDKETENVARQCLAKLGVR